MHDLNYDGIDDIHDGYLDNDEYDDAHDLEIDNGYDME
jgi:hypothetical protein